MARVVPVERGRTHHLPLVKLLAYLAQVNADVSESVHVLHVEAVLLMAVVFVVASRIAVVSVFVWHGDSDQLFRHDYVHGKCCASSTTDKCECPVLI